MPPSMTSTWRTPGSALICIDVGGLHLAGKDGSLFNGGVQHSRHFDIDAEDRLAGDDGVGVNARLRVANDAVILGIFELHAAERGRGQRGGFGGKLAIARRAPLRQREARGRIACALSLRHAPGLRGGGDEQLASGRTHAAHRLPALRRIRGAAGKLRAVNLLVQLGLLHAHVFPIDIQFLGNQHGQHVAHALAGLRGARHDGHHAIRSNVDEGLRRKVGRRAWPLRRGERRAIKIEREAAAGKGAQLQKRSAD